MADDRFVANVEVHSGSPDDIMVCLREATAAAHALAEAQLDLLRTPFDREDYVGVLRAFYGFYLPCERLLHAWEPAPAAQLYADGRHKVGRLVADLVQLGMAPQAIDQLPCSAAPAAWTMSAPSLWGLVYVLEGATLGGQLIHRHLRQQMPTAEGMSFLAGYRKDTGARWRAFQQALRAAALKPAERDEVIGAAQQTFTGLCAWFAAQTPPQGKGMP